MPEPNAPTIQLPSSPTPSKEEPVVIFTMPEAYRHGAMVAPMHTPEPVKKMQAPSPPKPTPPPMAPPVPSKTQGITKPVGKKSLVSPWVLVAGGIFILALGIVGSILYFSRPSPETISSKPTTQAPSTQEPSNEEETKPSVTTPVETEQEEPTDVFPAKLVPGQDADSDGLTNVEERLIYGTDMSLPDTDRDGFLDGNEVFHGYAPNGLSPSTLQETDLVTVVEWQGLSLLTPKTWETKGGDEGKEELEILASTGEAFRLQALEESFETFEEDGASEFVTKKGYRALMSEDQQKALVEIQSVVYEFSYEVGVKGTLDYVQTLYMMINSLHVL